MASALNMSHGKMSHFVSFSLFWFTLVIKLRNFDFGSHGLALVFFVKKIMTDWNMSCQTVSDLV